MLATPPIRRAAFSSALQSNRVFVTAITKPRNAVLFAPQLSFPMFQRILLGVLALLTFGLGVHVFRQNKTIIAAETRLSLFEAKSTQSPTVVAAPAPAVAPANHIPMPIPAKVDQPPQPAVAPTPEMQRLMNLRDRSIIDSQYAGLFKHLALPPDRLQKFQDILLQRRNIFNDVMAAMRDQGIAATPENAPQIQALVDNAVAEIELQIQGALGEDAYSRYKQYEATQMQRRIAARVEQRLSYSPEPLSEQQFARLVDVIAQDEQLGGIGAAQPLPGGPVPLPRITPAVVERARAFLSPVQMAGLQQIQTEQEASLQLARQTGGN